MIVIRILVALIQAILRITADALSHFVLLLAGVFATAAILIAIVSLSGTSALAILRRYKKRP